MTEARIVFSTLALGLILAAAAFPALAAAVEPGQPALHAARGELARELQKYGATPDEAVAQVRAMSDVEAERAMAELNPLPGMVALGGGAAGLAVPLSAVLATGRKTVAGRPGK